MQKLNLVLDKFLFYRGTCFYHTLDWNKTPHISTIGGTGSGKTFLNKLIIARVSLKIPDSSVTVLDFKAFDYKFCINCKNLYEFNKVKEGLEQYHNRFLLRQQGKDESRTFNLLVIEELGSMMSYFDKKEVEIMKAMIGNLIFMGRSVNFHLLVSTQRPDASYFNAGVRDSIGAVISLGNMSKEGKSMLFSGFQDEMKEHHGQGSGYMLMNGTELFSIKVPQVQNVAKLENYIQQALNR